MADKSFMGVVVSFTLFALFMAMVLSFSNGLGNNYGTDIEEMSGGAYNLSDYYTSINDINIEAEGYRERFESGDIEDVDDATGIFSVVNDMKNMVSAPTRVVGSSYSLLTQTLSNVLGIPDIAINVIMGFILSLAFIFLIWRLIKLGY